MILQIFKRLCIVTLKLCLSLSTGSLLTARTQSLLQLFLRFFVVGFQSDMFCVYFNVF